MYISVSKNAMLVFDIWYSNLIYSYYLPILKHVVNKSEID